MKTITRHMTKLGWRPNGRNAQPGEFLETSQNSECMLKSGENQKYMEEFAQNYELTPESNAYPAKLPRVMHVLDKIRLLYGGSQEKPLLPVNLPIMITEQ